MIARTARRVGARAVGSVDRAVGSWALRVADHGRAGTLDAPAREAALRLILPIYEAAFDAPATEVFPAPRPPSVALRRLGRRFGAPAWDLSWSSEYAPLCGETRDRYLCCVRNRRAAARVLSDPRSPRPTVVLLHGYLGGPHPIEERVWPIRRVLERGLDVALAVLPHHGPRRPRTPGRPAFPDNDPRLTVEGFRQAVHDVRGLVAWLLERGAPAVGVMGMSLGGYTAALLATLEPRLSFAVPLVPLASVADFARERRMLTGDAREQLMQHVLLERIYRVVSPLHRPPLVPPEGRLVLAAAHDGICPPSHAERIAEHWQVSLHRFYGSHILQLGRRRGFAALEAMLEGLGL